MENPVVHFEIMGKNASGLREFYHRAFDWKFAAPQGPAEYSVVPPDADGGIGGGVGNCPDGVDGHVTFYVQVPKLEETLSKIEELGGSTMMRPEQVPGGPRIAMFVDPESHVVGLVERTASKSS